MGTLFPDAFPTPYPGQPAGVGTFVPGHPYAVAVADGPFGNHESLADGLVSYWALDEESGTRYDSVGSNDLTDNNTVLYANTGPQGVTAKFTAADSDYLNANPGVGLLTGDFTIAGWVNFDNRSGYDGNTGAGWFASLPGGDADGSIICGVRASGVATVRYATGGTINNGIVTTSAFDGWHFLTVRQTSGVLSIWVDGESAATGAIGAESGWGTHHTMIGRAYPAAGNQFNDKIARVGVWSATSVSDSVVTSLYNSGLGKAYADLTAAEKVGLVSYWDLDEASGNRADSHGSNTLTDTNTVTSVDNTHPGFGKAASFVHANQEYLSHIDDPSLRVGVADFTFAFWYKRTADTALTLVLSKGGQNDYTFDTNPFSQTGMRFYCINGGAYPTANWGSALTLNQWYLIIGWRDGAAQALRLQVNDAAYAEVATGTIVSGDTNGALSIGGVAANSGTHSMGHVGFWSRVLTAQERTDLYNSGDGLFY